MRVFNNVVKGGSDTPTATLTVDGEFTMGAAQGVASWVIPISDDMQNLINSSVMPILIRGEITNENMGTINYELNLLRYVPIKVGEVASPTIIPSYSAVFTLIAYNTQSLAAIVICTEAKLQIITGG